MHRIIKLISIFVISLSVYWVYQKTSNSYYQIMSLGDQFSLGNTSYGVIENSYLDDMKEILLKTKENIEINQTYNEKDQSIKNCLQSIQNTPNIKKDLYDTDVLVISLGYNDLLYRLSIEEIRKYYKEDIIVLGYIEDSRFDGNKQIGIQKLNKILKNNKEVIFIDVNELLKDREKYYSNPRSHYPNALGYKRIATKIIQKTLENKENV